VVKPLPSKCEVLSSNPRIAKTLKKKFNPDKDAWAKEPIYTAGGNVN
jgi:hypothetical protein